MLEMFIDTREQKMLDFDQSYVQSVSRATMSYGDYGCKYNGERVPVVFERKSLPDLFGTMGKGFKRFKKELARAKADKVLLIIIIEKPLMSIRAGYKRSKMSGVGISRTLFTLLNKYGIPFVCCKNREEMSIYIQEFYYSWAKAND